MVRVIRVRQYRRRDGTNVGGHLKKLADKADISEQYERHRIIEPEMCVKGSFRTHNIGRKGGSKLILCRLKKNDRYATQSMLISHDEPEHTKQALRRRAASLCSHSI